MITELTKEQEDQLEVYRDKWLKIGLSTDRLDRDKVSVWADDLYTKILGREKPLKVFLDSPLSAWLGVCLLTENQVCNQVGNQVGNQVENQVWSQVWNQVWNQVENQVGNQVWNQVENQVENQVRNQVWNQVRNQVRNQVWNQVRNQVWNQVCNQVGNQVCNQAENQVRNQVRNQVWNQVWNQVCNQVGNQVGNQVENQVWSQVWNQVWNQVENQVWNQVWNQVENQVRDQVRNQVCNQVGNQVRDQVGNVIWPRTDGTAWCGYTAFYDYMQMCLGVKFGNESKWELWKQQAHFGISWCLENVLVMSELPMSIEMVSGQLHSDGSPSIKYADGFACWSLNGVAVPQWLAETEAGSIVPERLVDIENAEVRREFVRKVGIDRICHKLGGEPIDTQGNYELHKFKIADDNDWTYLKMLNPSLPEVWHVEGVPNNINTVQEALNYRNGLTEDQIDDENGADWYQQGDVIMRPKGVSKFKSQPIVLT